MAASPDIISGLLSDPNTAPYLGAAMGLLGSSGASRLPVTMGAAMGNALGGSQQYSQQVLQNAMARLQIGYKNWLLDRIQANQQQPTQSLHDLSQGTPTSATPAQKQLNDLNTSNSTSSAANPVSLGNLLLSGDPGMALQMPASRTTLPQSSQDSSDQGDELFPGVSPTERLVMESALWSDPGRLASTMYANDPNVAAQVARAKSMATLMNLRQGGGVYDPATGQMLQYNPRLPLGSELTPQGNVQVAPGYPLVSTQLEMLNQLATNATTPGAPGVGATGIASPRTIASGLGQPTTPQGIVNQVMVPPVIPSGQVRSPQTTTQSPSTSNRMPTNTVNSGPGGVPLPSNTVRAGPGAPVSLGAPITSALTAAFKNSTDSLQDAVAQGPEQQVTLGSLAEMQTSLNSLATGPGAAYRIQLEKLADGLGGVFGIKVPPFKDITNSQVLAKTTTQFAEAVVGAQNQNAAQSLQIIGHMVPNIENTTAANEINAGTLTATAAYKAAMAKWGQNWAKTYNGIGMDPKNGRWDGVWQQRAPFMAFLMNSLPPDALREMSAYAAKNSTLRVQMIAAQKAAPWLRKYGYLPTPNAGG